MTKTRKHLSPWAFPYGSEGHGTFRHSWTNPALLQRTWKHSLMCLNSIPPAPGHCHFQHVAGEQLDISSGKRQTYFSIPGLRSLHLKARGAGVLLPAKFLFSPVYLICKHWHTRRPVPMSAQNRRDLGRSSGPIFHGKRSLGKIFEHRVQPRLDEWWNLQWWKLSTI